MALTVLQLPLSVSTGLKVQKTSALLGSDGTMTSTSIPNSYVRTAATISPESPDPVVSLVRSGPTAGINGVTGLLYAVEADEAAFGGWGLQVGPTRSNVLSNSGMELDDGFGLPDDFTLSNPGALTVSPSIIASDLGESEWCANLQISNSTGNPQTAVLYQATTGSTSQWWNSQARVRVITVDPGVSMELRTSDETNAEFSTVSIETDAEDINRWLLYNTSHQLTNNSTDLRWALRITVPDASSVEVEVTNAMLANTAWVPHYVPSETGPTLRGSDDVDVVTEDFWDGLGLWSFDFATQGSLSTITGVSQTQYIFSTYSGANGTSLFVDDPNTITWRRDTGGVNSDVTLTPSSLGGKLWRVYLKTTTVGGSHERRMYIEDVVSGAITATGTTTDSGVPYVGTTMKLGRDNSNTNRFEGYIGSVRSWGTRTTAAMQRINSNWPA